jgi:hypothetical protein
MGARWDREYSYRLDLAKCGKTEAVVAGQGDTRYDLVKENT